MLEHSTALVCVSSMLGEINPVQQLLTRYYVLAMHILQLPPPPILTDHVTHTSLRPRPSLPDSIFSQTGPASLPRSTPNNPCITTAGLTFSDDNERPGRGREQRGGRRDLFGVGQGARRRRQRPAPLHLLLRHTRLQQVTGKVQVRRACGQGGGVNVGGSTLDRYATAPYEMTGNVMSHSSATL